MRGLSWHHRSPLPLVAFPVKTRNNPKLWIISPILRGRCTL
jgi:hypothetical protein